MARKGVLHIKDLTLIDGPLRRTKLLKQLDLILTDRLKAFIVNFLLLDLFLPLLYLLLNELDLAVQLVSQLSVVLLFVEVIVHIWDDGAQFGIVFLEFRLKFAMVFKA